MSLTREEVVKIAHLARLAVAEEVIPKYAKDLSNILDLVAQMNAVPALNVDPMAHPFDAKQRLREDVVNETDQHRLCQSVAPQVDAGLYRVPKVIE